MPRAKTKAKATIVGREGDAPQQGYFPFTVRTFQGTLPGEKDYDPDKDRMIVGFKFGNSTIPPWLPSGTKREEVTAYDFLTDPKTGMRAGQALPPHGAAYTNLTDGIGEWVDIPPIEIWRRGKWLSELVWEMTFDTDELYSWLRSKVDAAILEWPDNNKVPKSLYPYYVVSGEGTTGNNLYRVYELPEKKCGSTNPHHPQMWEEDLKKKKWGTLGGTYGLGTEQTKPVSKPAAPKPPPLPAGLRYRCPDCGHWFNQSDLPGHAMVCGKGEDADWAIMCHSDCGCSNLDEAAKPKDGFPRPKPVKIEEKKEEEPLALAVATP